MADAAKRQAKNTPFGAHSENHSQKALEITTRLAHD